MVRVPAVAPPPSSCRPICATVPLLTKAVSLLVGIPSVQFSDVNQLPLVGPRQISCAYEADDPIKIKLNTTGQRLADRKFTRNRVRGCTNSRHIKFLLNIATFASATRNLFVAGVPTRDWDCLSARQRLNEPGHWLVSIL